MLRYLLNDWDYVSLEEPGTLEFATSDPKGFIRSHPDRAIFDEIQRAPTLLSQLQVEIDNDRRPGRFVLSGSHNLLLLQGVSQSLAGRTVTRNLLPFSTSELRQAGLAHLSLEETLFFGGYAPVRENPTAALTWLDSYLQTYVERDVRLIRNISDLSTFRRFLRLCAGRVGQLLDLSSLGGDTGISHNTARDWLSVLEASFVAFRLEPYFKNYSKRLIKSHKIYFYDTGLLCRLLDIRAASDLVNHPFRGAVFENWCVLEMLKQVYAQGEQPGLYFWRDKRIEVDLLIQRDSHLLWAVECKSGQTAHGDFLSAPVALQAIMNDMRVDPKVVFGGDEAQERSTGEMIPWTHWPKQ